MDGSFGRVFPEKSEPGGSVCSAYAGASSERAYYHVATGELDDTTYNCGQVQPGQTAQRDTVFEWVTADLNQHAGMANLPVKGDLDIMASHWVRCHNNKAADELEVIMVQDCQTEGIAQLQSAMSASLATKASEPEVDKPGISELPRLPELSETSCIDVGDWLHALECPMGDISNGSAVWWREILASLDRFYGAYLTSSNLDKLSLRTESYVGTLIKEDRWSRVDKRATSMLLASLPEAIRAEVLASRLTGALQVLGRVMVLYRPGSAAERQQVLRALEAPATASNAADAVDALRRWARWLRRAGDIGLQHPDPCILLKGVDAVVKKVLSEQGEIQFRVNMLRYTLDVDAKPSLKSVQDLHQALLSDFEQVAFRGRSRPSGAANAFIKGMGSATTTAPASPTTTGDDNIGGETSPGKGKGAPCKFFLSDQGCRRGASCKYSHDVDKKQTQGRCWTCGSKQHVAKACPTKEKNGNPRSPARTTGNKPESSNATPLVAAMAPEVARPMPPAGTSPTSSVTATSTSSTTTASAQPTSQSNNGVGDSDLRDLLKEANNMLNEMRRLQRITVLDVEAKAKALGMDPGAFRQGTEEEMIAAEKVRVQLANGDHVTLAQNRAGTLLATASSPEDAAAPIVPLGSLVQELEDKRVEELQRTTSAMQRALWLWDQDATWSKHLHMFLRHCGRAHQLMTMDAEGSPFSPLSSTVKSSLAEDLVLDDKAGWKYLQAMPVSRRRRKLLMNSEWVVNLFSGPSDGSLEMKILDDGSVMVEVDILRSRAFDLRKAA
ncbi:unnamed protein product [Symbiodinium microadriaticum]|nr:unnamed protein product [Symbiodinium microadriaticum]CAE7389678.1 unnamed protein product [Symbiodinium sp. KB8]